LKVEVNGDASIAIRFTSNLVVLVLSLHTFVSSIELLNNQPAKNSVPGSMDLFNKPLLMLGNPMVSSVVERFLTMVWKRRKTISLKVSKIRSIHSFFTKSR
jgi:hypothetical protein